MHYCSVTQQMIFEELAITEGITIYPEAMAKKQIDPRMEQEIEERLKNDPENGDLWIGKAMIYFEDDFEKTIECLSMAEVYQPFNSDLHHYRGRKYLSLDKYAEAAAEFTKATRMDPAGRPKISTVVAPGTTAKVSAAGRSKWHYLGVALFYMGHYEEAITYFYKAIDLQLKLGMQLIPPSVDWIWMSYMRLGKPEEANAVLSIVDEDTPVEKDDMMYKNRVLLYKGVYSIQNFLDRVEYGHDLHYMTEIYGLAMYYYYTLKDREKALECLDKVLAVPTFHHGFAYKLALKERSQW